MKISNYLRIKGLLLFLFIPLTLILLLRFPIGLLNSLILAILVMLTHRFIARPYLYKYIKKKCIWCNGLITHNFEELTVKEKGEELVFAACNKHCREQACSFFSFTNENSFVIRWFILLVVFIYIIDVMLYYFGIRFIGLSMSKDIFKAAIAMIVLPVSLFYRNSNSRDLSFPLPVHNLFLLGVKNTLWVLRIIGAIWLIIVIKNILVR